tara:strand:+ start:370 stop:534 length:165 start_codon:yes stop_codon:yes gene_type:complete
MIRSFVVAISILMSTPIDKCSVKRSHKKMGRKQEEKPGVRGEDPIDAHVGSTEG